MKVLIVLDNLGVGGIARSLQNLLPRLSAMAECDLLVFDGGASPDICDGVSVLQSDHRLKMLGLSQRQLLRESLPMGMERAWLVLISRVFGGDIARRLLLKRLGVLKGYDLAISYSQDVGYHTISTGCNQFVLEQVEAKRKAAFIHCDYESFGGYHPKQEETYARFDRVVCVSQGCRAGFLRKFPSLEKTTVVCENFTDTDRIDQLLTKGAFSYDTRRLNVITVCRLGPEKGLLRAAEAIRRLKQENCDLLWTVVGEGEERKALETFIHRHGLDGHIRLVGGTDNPYYYMKNADVFLLPSYHEAAPMVFGECQALGLPVITTATASAQELVERRGLGVVCENSTEGLENALRALVRDGRPPRLPNEVVRSINRQAETQLRVFLEAL